MNPPTPPTQPQDVFGRPLNMRPCCLNLRHKMMFIDPAQMTPGMVDDGSDTRVFLCTLTQSVVGPDDAPVSARACDSVGRACFRGAAGSRPAPAMPTISVPPPGQSA